MALLRNRDGRVYITSCGAYMPGEPISNDEMEARLGLVAGKPSRLKKRILKSNGIQSRHYALDEDQRTTMLNEELASRAILDAVQRRGMSVGDLEMIAVGTTQGDLPVPGFASMVHGKMADLDDNTPPLEALSAGGVCASAMAGLKAAWLNVRTGERKNAVACGSELVSRMLKASRFDAESELDVDEADAPKGSFRQFDADFLRWMLSDGAGAALLEPQPKPEGLSLRLDWVTLSSYANEFEPCMYCGTADKKDVKAGNTWLDYANIALADQRQVMNVRQDTKILPNIVKLGVEEYLRLVKKEMLRVDEIDHVLCHYSSNFFRGEIFKLLTEAGAMVPEEKWFSNLETKGNTGAASIFIMLEEAMATGKFKKGDTIVLMVPESGRFTVGFAKLTVVGPEDAETDVDTAAAEPAEDHRRWQKSQVSARAPLEVTDDVIAAGLANSPLGAVGDDASDVEKWLFTELGLVWVDFERQLRNVPLLKRLDDGVITLDDYKRLLVNLRQQVMEGARWIARAASSLSIELFPLRSMFIGHAKEEHRDFQMLERDFVSVGGDLEEIQSAPKNVGSEALSAFMFHRASQPDPLDLLGAMFIIEGLGTAKATEWGASLKEELDLDDKQVTFLRYHGVNDDDHFEKLRDTIRSGIIDMSVAQRIVKTAKTVARLYALQLEEIDHV